MFEASVDGQLYDPERFATYYRPYGMEAPTGASAPRPASQAEAAPAVQDTGWQEPKAKAEPAPATEATPEPAVAGGDDQPNAQDILAMIRQRKQS